MRCFLGCFTASKPNKCFCLPNSPPINHLRDATTDTLPLVSAPLVLPITFEQPIEKKVEKQLSSNGETKVTIFDLNGKSTDVVAVGKNEEKEEGDSSKGSKSYEDLELKNESRFLTEEESSESLFSLSIDSRKQTYAIEMGEKEVSSVSFKTAKATTLTLHNQGKENINLVQETTDKCTSFELLRKKERANPDEQMVLGEEIAVDASLSSWLIEPETTNGSANSAADSAYRMPPGSPPNAEVRTVLGALTVSGSVTPRQRKSPSLENTIILGTVGSYWRRTGQADSDSCSSS